MARGASRWPLLGLAAVVLLVGPPAGQGTIILGQFDWNSATQGLQGWQSEFGSAQLIWRSSGGRPAGWLEISFPEIAPETPPGTNWYDLLYTPATNLFAGTWSTQTWVQFDFWASNRLPNQLSLRWQSLTNTYIWSYGLTITATQSWTTLSASLMDWQEWVLGPGATEEMFLSDLASINWIGIYVERYGPGAQVYGLDNFSLMVPEPGELTMLAAAAFSTWLFFRRRRRGARS